MNSSEGESAPVVVGGWGWGWGSGCVRESWFSESGFRPGVVAGLERSAPGSIHLLVVAAVILPR